MSYTEKDVKEFLYDLGFSPRHLGCRQLTRAILLAIDDPDLLLSVTKWLYPTVAEQFHTNWKAVEKNIRLTLESTWAMNRELFETTLSLEPEQRLRPKKFIRAVITVLGESAASDT